MQEGAVATLEHNWKDKVDLRAKHESVEALSCGNIFPSANVVASNSSFLERHLKIPEHEGCSQAQFCPSWPRSTAEVLQMQWKGSSEILMDALRSLNSSSKLRVPSAFISESAAFLNKEVPPGVTIHLPTCEPSLESINYCFRGNFWH